MPELGAKIYSIFYKPAGQEILWRNPSISPHRTSPSDSYDNHWSGGWDDLFPNDEAAFPESWNFPDHGELWSSEWNLEIQTADGVDVVHLQVDCSRSKVRVEKWISLAVSEAKINVRYRLTNLSDNQGGESVPFLFKLHPAMAISPGDRILLPAREFLLEPCFLGTLNEGELRSTSPYFEQRHRTVDLRRVAEPSSKELLFLYGTELESGTVILERPDCGFAVELSFPKEFFNTCWLFASYGGWNDCYVAVPEPCNGWPFRLEEAAADGHCGFLAAGEERMLSVEMLVRSL